MRRPSQRNHWVPNSRWWQRSFWCVWMALGWLIYKWAIIVLALVVTGIAVSLTLAGCNNEPNPPRPFERPGVVPDTPHAIIDSAASRPETADEAVDLQIRFNQAQAELARIKEEKDTALRNLTTRWEAATGTLNSLGKLAWLSPIAIIIAYFLGGWRTALVVAAVAGACAFGPMMLSDLWLDVRPWASLATGIAIIGLLVWVGALAYGQVRVYLQTNAQARNLLTHARDLEASGAPKEHVIALKSQAAVLEHVGTKAYDPHCVRIPESAFT